MGDLQDDRALGAVNKKSWSFRPSLQNALGAFMVVAVTSTVVFVYNLWDSVRISVELLHDHLEYPHARQVVEWKEFDQLRDAFRLHEFDGKRKHALIHKELEHEHEAIKEMRKFMQIGGPFTRDDRVRMQAQLDRIKSRLDRLELQPAKDK